MKARGRNILNIIENSLFWCQYSNVLTELRQEYGFLPHSTLKHYRTISSLHETAERISKEIYTLVNRRAMMSSTENSNANKRLVTLCKQLIAYQREKKAHADAALLELRQAQNSIAYCSLKHADDGAVAQMLNNSHTFQQSLFQQGQPPDPNEAQFSASDLFSCYRNFSAAGLMGPSSFLPLNPLIYEQFYMPDFNDLQMKTAGGKTTSGFSLPEIVKSTFPYTVWLTPEQQQAFNIDESKKAVAWSALMDNSYAANIFYKSCASFLGLIRMFDFDATFSNFCSMNVCDPQQRGELLAYWTHSYNTLKHMSEQLPLDEYTHFKLCQLEQNSRYRHCPLCNTLVMLGEECGECHYDGFAWINWQSSEDTLIEPQLTTTGDEGQTYRFPSDFFLKVLRDPIRLLNEIQQMLRKASQWYNGLLKQKIVQEQARESVKDLPKEQGHGIPSIPVLTSSSIIGSGVIRWMGQAVSEDARNQDASKQDAGDASVLPLNIGTRSHRNKAMYQVGTTKNQTPGLSVIQSYKQDNAAGATGKQSYSLFLRTQAEMSSTNNMESSDEVTVLYEKAQTVVTKPPRSSVRKQGHRRSSQENSIVSGSVSEHSTAGLRTETSAAYDVMSTNTDATEAGYCFCSKSNRKVCSDDMICCESNNCKFANEGWFHVDCLGLRIHSNEPDIMTKLEDVEFYCPGCYVEILKKHINGWPMIFPFLTTTEQRQALLEYVIKEWHENFSISLDRASRQIRRENTNHLHYQSPATEAATHNQAVSGMTTKMEHGAGGEAELEASIPHFSPGHNQLSPRLSGKKERPK